MILHQEDWAHYPSAIVDTTTTNTSFLLYVKTLKEMGIKNCEWPLALINPELQGVDPFSPDLTHEQCLMISAECKYNFWYYLREVCLVPRPGSSVPSRFLANRAVMAMYWCFFNNIDFFIIMPRQCGKSVGADVKNTWLLYIAGENLSISLITKDNDLRSKNIKRLKEFRDLLPDYLNPYQPMIDSNNQMNMTCKKYKNTLTIYVAQADLGSADKVGRGATGPIIDVDEIAYDNNIHKSLGVALSSAGTARDIAEEAGTFYANSYMTTAGTLDSQSGAFAHKLLVESYPWREALLDAGNRELAWKILEAASPDGDKTKKHRVSGVFSHRQIGKSDEWLVQTAAQSEQDADGIRRDYLNEWTSGSITSPLSKQLNKVIRQSEINPTWTQITKDHYTVDWFVGLDKLAHVLTHKETVLCVDPSQMIGSDSNGTVIQLLETMEVIGTTAIVSGIIHEVAHFYANLLISFPRMTMIIENTVSGQAILDIVAADLIKAGINPFFRIYNDIVNRGKIAGQAWEEIMQYKDTFDMDLYRRYKPRFGFKTTGNSRPILYGQTFQRAAKSVGHLVRSKELIDQILGLVTRNGRVDHPSDGHDDLVIGWLLGHWFATYGENLSMYGIRPGVVQSMVSEEGAVLSPDRYVDHMIRERIMARLNFLKDQLSSAKDDLTTKGLLRQIQALSSTVEDEVIKMKINDEISEVLEAQRQQSGRLSDRARAELEY